MKAPVVSSPSEKEVGARAGLRPGRSRNALMTVLLLAAMGTALYEACQAFRQAHTVQALARQVQQLQQEREQAEKRLAASAAKMALHLPVPPMQLSAPPKESTERSQPTNLLAGFPGLKGKAPNKLSAAQVESFLQAHGRAPASLLAAYRATGDGALLQEALQKHPKDPQVALAAVLQKDASPETRRQWLDTFKAADADNALPYYLSALNYLQAGQTDQAVPELMAAYSKSRFQDYALQRTQTDAQVYLAAGYSVAEANALGPLQEAMYLESRDGNTVNAMFPTFQSQLSYLEQMKALTVGMCDLANSYTQAGDSTSAQAALQMALNLGQHFSSTADQGGLSQLVGMAAEVLTLSRMDPNSPYGDSGQTVQERIDQLRQERKAIRGLYQDAVPLLGTMSEPDWSAYTERVRFFGEQGALQWVVGKYGQK